MAEVTKPIALDESLNTTETPSRNIADVIAQSLASLIAAMPATVLNNLADVVITLPTDGQTMKYDSVSQKWVNADDAGGHTIEGADGTALSQEPTLQFADADAADDAVNEKTVVNVVRKRTQAEYDAMSAADKAKGVIEITDANAKPLFDSQVRHGDNTVNALLNQIGYLSGLRFKNLGTSFTAEQQAAIASGDLTDFWNGDYWVDEAQGITWRVVDNTGIFRRKGNDAGFDSPSLVIMPDEALLSDASTKYMADSDSTALGYNGTNYRNIYRSQCRTKFNNFFGSAHIAEHYELISVATSNFDWVACDIELPSETNIFGHNVFTNGFSIGSDWGHFRLFTLAPYMAVNRSYQFWLRNVYSGSQFSRLTWAGSAQYANASSTGFYPRPYGIII